MARTTSNAASDRWTSPAFPRTQKLNVIRSSLIGSPRKEGLTRVNPVCSGHDDALAFSSSHIFLAFDISAVYRERGPV